MQLSDFKILTFDCYGTLIDWESGIVRAMEPLLARSGKALSRDDVLATFARYEASQQSETPSMIYSKLLAVVHSRIGSEWGVKPNAKESEAFGQICPRLACIRRFTGSTAIPEETLQASSPFKRGPGKFQKE